MPNDQTGDDIPEDLVDKYEQYRRKFIIDDDYRKKMKDRIKVHREKLDEDLTQHTEQLDDVITDHGRLGKELFQAKKIWKKIYDARAYYYNNEVDDLPQNRDELKDILECDGPLTEATEIVTSIEDDMKYLMNLHEILKQKYWNIKTLIDFEKWRSGE